MKMKNCSRRRRPAWNFLLAGKQRLTHDMQRSTPKIQLTVRFDFDGSFNFQRTTFNSQRSTYGPVESWAWKGWRGLSGLVAVGLAHQLERWPVRFSGPRLSSGHDRAQAREDEEQQGDRVDLEREIESCMGEAAEHADPQHRRESARER